MQMILGPFHPHLEDALVEEISGRKKKLPLSPLLILVPSDSLRRRLKVLLTQERGLNLLNLHILTFYQLSRRLLEERDGARAVSPQDDSVLEEILRQIIRMRLPGAEPFAGLEEKAGGSASLWQTLRDLKDGLLSPAVALEAAKGDLFEETTPRVEKLLALFETFLSCCDKWGLRDYADLDLLAAGQVVSSAYLRQFDAIYYYGFYDLTQVQLDLFQAVARQYPVTLFFPIVHRRPAHPAWTFADRFYERYLHGLATAQAEPRNLAAGASILPLFRDAGDTSDRAKIDHPPVRIFSCFSGRDEIDTAAKEILRLVSEENFSFEEIGVVGRTLEPYRASIKDIFFHHAIPFTSSAEEPLAEHPLAKSALLLANLPLRGYLRSQVVDLFDSPFFNRASGRADVGDRPDLWDLVTRRLGIAKGIEQWRRLETHLEKDVALPEEDDDEGKPKGGVIPAEQARSLWRLFTRLHRDLEQLPKEATWSFYVGKWQTLQHTWLANGNRDETQKPVADKIEEVLRRLAVLDAVGENVSLSHFLETYQHWLERASVPGARKNTRGVAVLDAMAARGISFRALFIVGLNEGLFPRTIREDAFLRDRERQLLETALGYKVATKLGGFDEERLLFTLLVGAATERLYCLHQRNDESGKPMAPSWYLEELGRALGREQVKEIALPRGTAEKQTLAPFDRDALLPPEELAIRLILSGKDPLPMVNLCLPSPALYQRGSQTIEQLETIANRLAGHDGIVGSIPDHWRRIAEGGLSPTSLEGYARCPFQYFARAVLGLERLERPEEVSGPGPADLGQIVHTILKLFYQELMEHGFFLSKERSLDTTPILQAVTQRAFVDFERDNPVGYPLAWEILREEIATLLEQAVAEDLKELRESDYRPHALEQDATVRLPKDWPGPLNELSIHGRMDRIDFQPEKKRYRVIDYKLKLGRHQRPEDGDLLRAAVQGRRLQPPFYLLLGKESAARGASVDAAAFYFLAPQWPGGPLVVEPFPADGWEGASGGSLKETVATLAQAIRQGLFFVQPADYCRYCEASEACRKNHRPTMWRAERDPRSRAHLDLRKKKAEPK
jgi:ATP-dependent helicase/nuclease subunit B